MYTLQQVLNPLVIEDGGVWMISCPGMPFGGEGRVFDDAVEDLISQIRYHTTECQHGGQCIELRPRVQRILQCASDERIRKEAYRVFESLDFHRLQPA